MELSLEDALRICKELWTWLAESGTALKADWPGWDKYGRMHNNCPFCEYAGGLRIRNGLPVCCNCPYYQKFGLCSNTLSPYIRWCRARTVRTNKKYAKLFLAQLEQL